MPNDLFKYDRPSIEWLLNYIEQEEALPVQQLKKSYVTLLIKEIENPRYKMKYNVLVEGTKQGLVKLALDILKLASCDFQGCHVDMDSPFFDEFNGTLTISLLLKEGLNSDEKPS